MDSHQEGGIATRLLIQSDTHGLKFDDTFTAQPPQVDLVIHCGDLTEESKLFEFEATLDLLRKINAPVKVVIAGNHEITLEEETYKKHLAIANIKASDEVVIREYGNSGEARKLLDGAKEEGIYFVARKSPCTPTNGHLEDVQKVLWGRMKLDGRFNTNLPMQTAASTCQINTPTSSSRMVLLTASSIVSPARELAVQSYLPWSLEQDRFFTALVIFMLAGVPN